MYDIPKAAEWEVKGGYIEPIARIRGKSEQNWNSLSLPISRGRRPRRPDRYSGKWQRCLGMSVSCQTRFLLPEDLNWECREPKTSPMLFTNPWHGGEGDKEKGIENKPRDTAAENIAPRLTRAIQIRKTVFSSGEVSLILNLWEQKAYCRLSGHLLIITSSAFQLNSTPLLPFFPGSLAVEIEAGSEVLLYSVRTQ